MRGESAAPLITLVLVLLSLPFVPWLPMLAHVAPWLGWPPYDAAQGAFFWQIHLWYGIGYGMAAAAIWRRDRWLAAAVAYLGLVLVWRGAYIDPTHGMFFTVGALAVTAMSVRSESLSSAARFSIITVALFEAGYVLLQFDGWDPLWGPWLGGTPPPKIQPYGTLGSVNSTAMVLAIAAPLVPWPLAVGFGILVFSMKSLGALAALVAGLVARWLGVWGFIVAAVVVAGLSMPCYGPDAQPVSTGSRYDGRTPWCLHKETQGGREQIWRFALSDWVKHPWAVVFGYGTGSWQQRVPALQVRSGYAPTREVWAEAHNEWIQWLVETGLIGAVVAGLWLWSRRGMFSAPRWGGPAAAVLVSTFSWHTFHLGVLGLIGAVVIAMAIGEAQRRT